jgi:hypothetical protein
MSQVISKMNPSSFRTVYPLYIIAVPTALSQGYTMTLLNNWILFLPFWTIWAIQKPLYPLGEAFSGVNYQAIDSSFVIIFDGRSVLQVQSHFMDSLSDENLKQSSDTNYAFLETLTKAYLQNYFYRLNKNLLADTLPLYP